MNFQQLTTFCAVVSEGSMTAAAEKLYLTQPAVSQQIRNLEDEIGSELLVRGVRNVKPTLQGQLLYDYAKRILYLTQQAEVALQAISTELKGSIRIGTLNSIGLYLISPIIGLFLKHNTQLHIKLTYGNTESLVKGLMSDELDVVIVPEQKGEIAYDLDPYGNKFLMKDEMWLVGSGRDDSLPQSIALKEFVDKPIVYFTDKYAIFRNSLEAKLAALNLEFLPVFEADNVGTLKRVIESGLGWGFLPSHSIYKQVRTGRMSRILVQDMSVSASIHMYYRQSKQQNEIVSTFYRALKQQALG